MRVYTRPKKHEGDERMKRITAWFLCLVTALFCLYAAFADGYTLKLSPTSIRLAPGESRSLAWSVEPKNLVTHTLTFTSDNPYVASVDDKGKITGKAAGSTRVRATLETGTSRSVTVTVTGQPVTRLTITNPEVQLEVGETAVLEYTINESADDKRVKWSSDDTSVATVDKNGKVTAVGGGVATVTLLAVNGMTATAIIYVPSEVKRIQIDPAEAYLGIGASMELDAYVFPGNARNRELIWESRDESIARVDQNGVVTGVSEGDCYIRAMCANGVYATTLLHVSLLPMSLSLSPAVVVLTRDDKTRTLTVGAIPAGAENAPLTWSSSDEAVVSVAGGVLTAKGYGQAQVSAEAVNGVRAEVTVYVSEPPTSVRFESSAYTLPQDGDSIRLVPVFSPEGSITRDYTFSVDDESVAIVDKDGNLTPLSYGVCRVTLTTAGGLSCQADVRVYENVKSLRAAESNVVMKQYEFRPVTLYSETGKPYLSEPTAFVDDENVCVYANGQLYAKNPGKARVTFSNPGTTVTCQVNVTVLESDAVFTRCVALTFDNGPDKYTSDILDVLSAYGVKATFFVLGTSIEAHPEQMALLGASPHELGNHTYDNSSIASGSVAETASGLQKTDQLCQAAAGRTPTVLRAPDALLPAGLFSSFLDTRRFIGRGFDMNDTDGTLSFEQLYEGALACTYNTSVLTFHDCGPNTAEALKLLVPELLKRGYRFLTVSELIEYTGNEEMVFSTKP